MSRRKRTNAMTRFALTPIKNKGRSAWIVSYGSFEEVGGRRKWRRRQNMFLDEGRARQFLEACRREHRLTGRVKLVWDRDLHWDMIRAMRVLSDLPGATLESSAWLLRTCRSSKEQRGTRYEVPVSRVIELEPRAFLGVSNEARKRGIKTEELIGMIVWMWLEKRAWEQMQEARAYEARERAAKAAAARKNWQMNQASKKEAEQLAMYQEACRALEGEYANRGH